MKKVNSLRMIVAIVMILCTMMTSVVSASATTVDKPAVNKPLGRTITVESVNHIELDVNLSAKMFVNGSMKDVVLSIDEKDAESVKVTAMPENTEFTVNEVIASTDSNGVKRIRINGDFPVGTKENPVTYNVSFEKTVVIDNVELPVIVIATTQYWTVENVCNEHIEMSLFKSGICLKLDNLTVENNTKGCIQIQNNLNGFIPKKDFSFVYQLTNADGEVYRDNIMVTVPTGKNSIHTIIANVDFGEYELTCDAMDEELTDYECEGVLFSSKNPTLAENRNNAFVNVITKYKELCKHVEVIDKEVPATCLETGLTEGIHCSLCDEILIAQEEIPALGHDIIYDAGRIPTCTEAGFTVGEHCSRCDYKVESQEVPIVSHVMGEWTVTVEPTCITLGEERSTCKNCEYFEVRTLTLVGHTEAVDEGKDATCLEAGITEGKHCSVCKTVIVEQEEIPALGHDIVIDEAIAVTCEKDGKTEGEHCTRCDYKVKQKKIEATGHDMKMKGPVEPTCHSNGYTAGKKCSKCGYTAGCRVIAPTKHKPAAIRKKAPTCTENGLTEGSMCSICYTILAVQESVPAIGHDMVDAEGLEPTCTEVGYKAGKACTRCDYVEHEEIPALGHDGEWRTYVEPTCTTPGKESLYCARCDYHESRDIEPLGHDVVVKEAIAATCTTDGMTEGQHCKRCNTLLAEQKPIYHTGHKIVVDNAVPATCTEKGLTKGEHCANCDYKVEQEEVAALEHNMGAWKLYVATTCVQNGEEQRVCSRCHEIESRAIPMNGHSEVIDARVEPTCLTTGYTEGKHCSVCRAVIVKQEIIPNLGHDIKTEEGVAATCTTAGTTPGSYCTRCNYKVGKSEIKAFGHNIVIDAFVAPTCEAEGKTEGSHCTRCDYKVEQLSLKAIGHLYGEMETTEEPTCTEKGEQTHYCQRSGCKAFETEEIPVIAHTPVIEEAIPATCTETGLSEGQYCDVCKTVIVEQEVVPFAEHTLVLVNQKNVSYSQCGYTGDIICSVCEAIIETGTEIPVLKKPIAPKPAIGAMYSEDNVSIMSFPAKLNNNIMVTYK